jgi:hypothetical protein
MWRFSILGVILPAFPRIGMTMQMKNCEDYDSLFSRYEVDAVWKTIHQASAHARINLGKLKRMFTDSL